MAQMEKKMEDEMESVVIGDIVFYVGSWPKTRV